MMKKLLLTMLLALILPAIALAQDDPEFSIPAPTIASDQHTDEGYLLIEITDEEPDATIYYCISQNDGEFSDWIEYTSPFIITEPGMYVIRAFAHIPDVGDSEESVIAIHFHGTYYGTVSALAYAHLIDEENGLKVHFIANEYEYDLVVFPVGGEEYAWPTYGYYRINGTGEWHRINMGDYICLPDYGDYTIELYGCADGYHKSRTTTAVVHYDPENYYSVCERNIVYNGLVYFTTPEGTAKVAKQYNPTMVPYFYIEYEGDAVIPEVLSIEGENYTVTSIDDEAFAWHSSISSLSIPKTLTSIGDNIFGEGCTCLTLNVEDGNPVFDSRDNCNAIIETATNKLLYGCTETIIPGTVAAIGVKAFRNTGIVHVDIPNSVTAIDDEAFYQCPQLESVTIPNSVTSMGKRVFSWCQNLTSANIPNSLTAISEWTFMGCSSLTDIVIPNSITSIGNLAFNGCSSLSQVVIPNSVTEIGASAFSACTSLTSISIPEGITAIQTFTFNGCTNLASITIPSTLTSIARLGLGACDNLARITCHAVTPPDANGESFDYYSNPEHLYQTATLFVKNEAIEAYRAHEEWGKFQHIVPFIGAGPGDINGDGNLSVSDVTNLLEMLLNGNELPPYADVNGDGNITISDITMLINMMLNGY